MSGGFESKPGRLGNNAIGSSASRDTLGPGKRTLTEQLPPDLQTGTAVSSVQRRSTAVPGDTSESVHAAAAHGIAGSSTRLPHLDLIQRSFGHHDVSGIEAHTDGAAAAGASAMGAQAFATGNHVAFAGAPDLHTTAHEAAHVVQQRGGVQLRGGVGEAGDAYERHADAVADAVVAGKPAGGILDQMQGGASHSPGVQKKPDDPPNKKPGPKPVGTHKKTDFGEYWVVPDGTKPAAAKGRYMKKITVSSTMGPGVRVDTNRLKPDAE